MLNTRGPLSAGLAAGLLIASGGCGDQIGRPINFGAPTTVRDSGLLEVLKAAFERGNGGYRLRVITAGSGELLALGERGDVDVLLSHSPPAEAEFMEAGHGLLRRQVMENDFVIVGPRHDPARIRGMADASVAFARISRAGVPFLSRGDDSGTHRREIELRADAGMGQGSGYRALGQGMGAVLHASSELEAYTLTDRATFRSLMHVLELEVMVQGDTRLRNVYSVIVANRARDHEGAQIFADWVTSDDGREAIADYGVERFGEPLFRPISVE